MLIVEMRTNAFCVQAYKKHRRKKIDNNNLKIKIQRKCARYTKIQKDMNNYKQKDKLFRGCCLRGYLGQTNNQKHKKV